MIKIKGWHPVRVSLTHQDMNCIMLALDCLKEELRYDREMDTSFWWDEIHAVENKIQSARKRMKRKDQ